MVSEEKMGEVRVTVKLINATDEKLISRGLLNPNLLRVYETQALVDTGATRTVIPMNIVQLLGLRISSQQIAQFADSRQELVGLTSSVIIRIEGLETIQTTLVFGSDVLISQTVLEDLNLLVDCRGECLTPNPKKS
jgi:clan AA aspartic protease